MPLGCTRGKQYANGSVSAPLYNWKSTTITKTSTTIMSSNNRAILRFYNNARVCVNRAQVKNVACLSSISDPNPKKTRVTITEDGVIEKTIPDMPERKDESTNIAKEATVGAVETGLKLGEMAKDTMDGMWDAVKKTAEGVKDSVEDADNSRDSGQTVHSDKEFRRKTGGY